MKSKLLFISFLLFLLNPLFSQTKPFPQNITYPYGFKPTTVTSAKAQSEYNNWKGQFLSTCGENLMPVAESGFSKIIAVSLGMMAAAYEGDKDVFDKLLGFYKSKLRQEANNMMAWHVTCSGTIDNGSSTDGEIDVAFSLIVAYVQWGGSYLDDTKLILQKLRGSVFTNCSGIWVLNPGYYNTKWGGCSQTSISHYTPAFFRIFAQVMNDDAWNKLADDTYYLLSLSANIVTGLAPDWQTSAGGGVLNFSFDYGYDASRIPWRIALDYIWNGNANALSKCNKITNWARKIGTSNIKNGYTLNGTPTGTSNVSSFVGGFAIGAMCNSQIVADTFATRVGQLNDSYWYDYYSRVVYLHVLTGNFWKPDISTAILSTVEKQSIKIYPNPLNYANELKIEGTCYYNSWELVALTGSKISSGSISSQNTLSLPITSLKKGVYLITLSDKSGNTNVLKFIK